MAVRPLIITAPDGCRLAGMAHTGAGPVGVLIVPGAPQTRVGAHRGFVALAGALAARGHPVLRFDRRGLGDSDGEDPGFRGIGPDIAAAGAALRAAFPHVRRVIGLGLCDGAAALALNPGGCDALALLNPWLADSDRMGDLPPAAAIRTRYRDRLRQPRQWLRLLSGEVRLGALLRGLRRAASGDTPTRTALAMAERLAAFPGPVMIALAGADATAQAFARQWHGAIFERARRRGSAQLVTIPGAGHTFAGQQDAAALTAAVTRFAARC